MLTISPRDLGAMVCLALVIGFFFGVVPGYLAHVFAEMFGKEK